MPSCTICTHSQRNEIEKLLIKGQSERVIANQFSITQGSLHRHKDSHLNKILLKARELEEMLHADDLLGQIKSLQERAYKNLDLAESELDVKSISMALREARGSLELLARLLGKLQETKVVNVLISPEWMSLKIEILNALSPYPEAREAIVEALQNHIDGGNDGSEGETS